MYVLVYLRLNISRHKKFWAFLLMFVSSILRFMTSVGSILSVLSSMQDSMNRTIKSRVVFSFSWFLNFNSFFSTVRMALGGDRRCGRGLHNQLLPDHAYSRTPHATIPWMAGLRNLLELYNMETKPVMVHNTLGKSYIKPTVLGVCRVRSGWGTHMALWIRNSLFYAVHDRPLPARLKVTESTNGQARRIGTNVSQKIKLKWLHS